MSVTIPCRIDQANIVQEFFSKMRMAGSSVRGAAVAILCLWLFACSNPSPLSMDKLRPPLEEVPGAHRIEIKSEVDVSDFDADNAPVAVAGLRAQNITESAYYKYHLDSPQPAVYKLKLSIYSDAASREQAWARTYPDALLQGVEPRPWGDSGFIMPGKAGAFGLGRVVVNVQASGKAADQLETVLERMHERAKSLKH